MTGCHHQVLGWRSLLGLVEAGLHSIQRDVIWFTLLTGGGGLDYSNGSGMDKEDP